MTTLGDFLLGGLNDLLSEHLGEFVLVQAVLLGTDLVSRLIAHRRQLDSGSRGRKVEGWYNVLAVGPDLCLMALGGTLVAAKLSSDATATEFFPLVALLIVTAMLAVSFIFGSMRRKPQRLFFDKAFFLGVHLPNTVGFVCAYLAAIMIGAQV